MKHEDAEEYTQALGQVVAGGWRQVALGKRLGVPKALGLSVQEWVEQRLGGYVRMSINDRREAVAELAEEGMSVRETAEVLGVDKNKVWRDRGVSNETTEREEATKTENTKAEADEGVSFETPSEPSLPGDQDRADEAVAEFDEQHPGPDDVYRCPDCGGYEYADLTGDDSLPSDQCGCPAGYEGTDPLDAIGALAVGEVREKEKRKAEARTREPAPVDEPVAPPEGQYSCIVIDPPWPMQKIERDERPNQGTALDYAIQSIEDIADENWVPVRSVAADDCHIYLWVTQKYLPSGLWLIEQWGFRYQCVMTWRKNVGITPFSWMYDTEHVLFGTRGDLPLSRKGLRLSFEAPVQGHSIKPDVFYERVTEASPGPRIDMFPGVKHDGFEPWGLEASHRAV